MTEQENIDLVRKGYEAFGRGDVAGLLATLDEQVLWVTSGPADLPTAGRRRGHEGAREFVRTLSTVVDVERFEPKQFVAQGDLVIVLGTDAGRLKSTGKTFDMDFAHAFTIRNGKVAAFQEYRDTSALVTELRGARVAA